MHKFIWVAICSLGFTTLLNAQIGGQRAYEFLNLPANARLSALGGFNITSGWNDPTQVLSNPALLNDLMYNQAVINRLGYFADISLVSLSYATEFNKVGSTAFGLSYLNYGDIESFDPNGFLSGTVSVNEYVFSVSNSQKFGALSVGATLKLAVSDLATFQSSAALFDLGGLFKHPEKDFTIGFAVKNLGFLISDYTDGRQSQLPFDIQLGTSFKPEFMPIRFSITTRNLVNSDVVFFDPASNNLIGATAEPGFSEELFRRLVFGTEILVSPNFQLRMGYNHLLRKELSLENASGGAGFSFGFMFKVKRFEFSYARALYHVAGGSNSLQLNMSLNALIKKKKNND